MDENVQQFKNTEIDIINFAIQKIKKEQTLTIVLLDKIYYRREYTETPSELQKSRKEYEKELELQKEQKEQKENIAKQAVVDDKAPPALPVSPTAAALPKRKEIMVGGGFFDSDFKDVINCKECFTTDDILISKYLKYKNVSIKSVVFICCKLPAEL